MPPASARREDYDARRVLVSYFVDFKYVNCIALFNWYLVFKQDKDNRIQYIMHTIVMILCPLVGPLYFLLGFLKYHFMKLGERDLSDVEFAKKRHVSRVKCR